MVTATIYEFGDFKLDCDRFELYRAGRSVKLERKPMELLVLLATRNGHLVTRAEIAERLWDKEVFVDTEHGINTAIRKIREVLNDDPAQSRFVQTVTGKGYRFTASVVEVRPSLTEEEIGVVDAGLPDAFLSQPATGGKTGQSQSRRLWIWLAALGAAAVLIFLIVKSLPRRGAVKQKVHSLAVLPLVNLSGDPSQEYFADGMTDELITALAKNRSLRIVSRTSAMQYKNANKPLTEIARALGVDGILEGSVVRSGDRVHVNLQLIYAPTDTHMWAESYDRDASEALSLPDELSQTIATQAGTVPSTVKPRRHVSSEAHDAYLQGLFYWYMDDYDRSTQYFEKAIQLQPDYAAAWSGLGTSYGARAVTGRSSPREFAESEADTRKALELDDSLPEAHNSLAAIYLFRDWNWKRAQAESQRALELNPNFAEGHHIYSYILFAQNRDREALQEQKLATDLDPLDRPWALGQAYMDVREFDAAIDELQARARFRRDFWTQFKLSEAYQHKGMSAEAAEHMEQAFLNVNDEKSAAAVMVAFKAGGFHGVSEWQLNQTLGQRRQKYVSPFTVAWDYARLKRKEETLATLDEAFKQRSPWLVFLQKEPAFDFLHSDERYQSLVRRIGLSPAY